jgi:quinol monooxygenase YgiN
MRIVAVVFTVSPDRLDAFQALAMQHAHASLGEPGCRQFDVASDPGNPGRILFYEVYDDDAAFAAHRETAHYKQNAPRFAEYALSRERADFVMLPAGRPKR